MGHLQPDGQIEEVWLTAGLAFFALEPARKEKQYYRSGGNMSQR